MNTTIGIICLSLAAIGCFVIDAMDCLWWEKQRQKWSDEELKRILKKEGE